jgi:uncharacterized membrane protein YjgN (DUF898 family)
VIRFEYRARGGQLFKLGLVNTLLTLVTLGFYFAWARVKALRFLIGAVHVDGEPLTFHAEGRELFWGVIRAFFVFLLPLYILLAMSQVSEGSGVFLALFYVGVLLIGTYAMMSALRFRARRTTWRGIRFAFDGGFRGFFGPLVGGLLLIVVTLGLAWPYVEARRHRYVMENLRFGSERFGFDASLMKPLFGRWLLCLLLAPFTLGLSLFWYAGHQMGQLWSATTFAGGRFRSTLSGGQWLAQVVAGSIFTTLTLGIAAPWVYVSMHRLFFETLSLEGADLARVSPAQGTGSAFGEAGADLLDVDGGLDL